MRFCSHCGKELENNARFCPSCGAATTESDASYESTRRTQSNGNRDSADEILHPTAGRSRIVAGILGIVLGFIGAHKFYCGKISSGVIMAIFFWTGIPAIIGFIEGIIYLTCPTDEQFVERYCIIEK